MGCAESWELSLKIKDRECWTALSKEALNQLDIELALNVCILLLIHNKNISLTMQTDNSATPPWFLHWKESNQSMKEIC